MINEDAKLLEDALSPFPLSFAQERMWFLEQLDPSSSVYNTARAYRLTGPLSLPALEKSFSQIIRRHEILRSTIHSKDGIPYQVISATSPSIKLFDLQELPQDQREAKAILLVSEQSRLLFDLVRGPLVRLGLVRIFSEEHILFIGIHHIVSDGWSWSILLQELSLIYASLVTNVPCQLTELRFQYRDFVSWQREWLQDDVLKAQLSYWQSRLFGAPTSLNLSTDHVRPAVQTYEGSRAYFSLSSSLVHSLKNFSRTLATTLFMTLIAAMQALLHRYTNQEDIIVGTPIAGRTQVETEELIGLFVNTLALRVNTSGDPSFHVLLKQVKEITLGAIDHQHLPFEKLIHDLKLERDLSRGPLFQVMLVLQNVPEHSLKFTDLDVDRVELSGSTAKFDFSMCLTEVGGVLKGYVDFNTALFDASTIERMLRHFEMLLTGIVENPNCRLSELPLLRNSEREQILLEWNRTERQIPKDRCVQQIFEEEVIRSADKTAVRLDKHHLNFRDLNSKANQVAQFLIQHGVSPESLVGLYFERSIEMLVGLIGVLKSGGAYIPLDPAFPKQRLDFLLKDTQASVVLTQEKLKQNLPPGSYRVLCLDSDWTLIAEYVNENPPIRARNQNVAYALYTSGSTGQPKGVLIEHKSLLNYLTWVNEFLLDRDTTLPAITPLTFDASLKQLIAPLLRGKPAWLLSEEVAKQPLNLLEALLNETDITLNCVPSLWKTILDCLDQAQADSIRKNLSALYLGGERLEQKTIQKTMRQFPDLKIWNLYGPTETTANACADLVQDPKRASTIGRPVSNTQVYLLDSHLNPVPVGIPGDIFIGGEGVARGYLGHPELTAENFIPDPFSGMLGSRLFRTRDSGKYLPDGRIEFLGRSDDQVKIRGIRVEVGEVEAAIQLNPAVKEVVVLAWQNQSGDNHLVAYVVAVEPAINGSEDLRRNLRQILPEYMIPSAFVFLERFNLLPSGKLDRKALQPPDRKNAALAEHYVAPRNTIEKRLEIIWSSVLLVNHIGVYDNFFELGGHSLNATQAISRIRNDFKLNVPLRFIFEAPSIAELALLLDQFESHTNEEELLTRIVEDLEALSEEDTKKIVAERSKKLRTSE